MEEEVYISKSGGNKVNISGGDGSVLALVLFIACFWGEPDLIDALISFFLSF